VARCDHWVYNNTVRTVLQCVAVTHCAAPTGASAGGDLAAKSVGVHRLQEVAALHTTCSLFALGSALSLDQ
jgi:hypothetical protein